MTGEDIAVASTVGPIMLALAALIIQVLLEGTEDKLWPRGLRWFPGWWLDNGERLHRLMLRIFWPERLETFKGRRLLRLENWDQQWQLWAPLSEGEIPEWKPWPGHRTDGRWEPRPGERS